MSTKWGRRTRSDNRPYPKGSVVSSVGKYDMIDPPTRVSLSDKEFWILSGVCEAGGSEKNFDLFNREFKTRVDKAKYLYRGMTELEYERIIRTKKVHGTNFSISKITAKSMANHGDVVIRIPKPKEYRLTEYSREYPYASEMEVKVKEGTKLRSVKLILIKGKEDNW